VIPLQSGRVPVDIRSSDNTSVINEINTSMERIVNTLITNDRFERDRTSIKIPGFQHGGVVQSSTLAQIGEAGHEAVIPLEGGELPVNIRETSSTNIITKMSRDMERINRLLIHGPGRITQSSGGIIEQITNSIQQPVDAPNIQLQAFATGGIVNTPTAAMIGERGAEAVVPIRGGSIPVEMRGNTHGPGILEGGILNIYDQDLSNFDPQRLTKQVEQVIGPALARAASDGIVS